MRFNEFKDRFGVKTPSVEEVAKKHGVSINDIRNQLKKGITAETEHTNDFNMALEIALDHLNEIPDYYDRLEKMEK